MKQSLRNEIQFCKYEIVDLMRSILAMFEMIKYPPFDDHPKLVEDLVTIQEAKCEEMKRKVEVLYEKVDESGLGEYEMEKTMVTSVINILRAQVVGKKKDTDGPICVKIDSSTFHNLINQIMFVQ